MTESKGMVKMVFMADKGQAIDGHSIPNFSIRSLSVSRSGR